MFFIYAAVQLLTLFSLPEGGNKKEFYPSGELMAVRIYDTACNCQRVTEYYQSGSIRRTLTLLQAGAFSTRIIGADILFYEHGDTANFTFWKDGAPDGLHFINFENGKRALDGYYQNGFKEGVWKLYNEDQSLRQETHYKPGMTSWESERAYATHYYYSGGNLVYEEMLEDGKRVSLNIKDQQTYERVYKARFLNGKSLFMAHCAACHTIDDDVVGPKLRAVVQKRPEPWLRQMIINGQALVASGDTLANQLFRAYHQVQHPDFGHLEPAQLDALIAYLSDFREE